jgi:ketosteroid isomerase-like protein
VVIGQGIRRGSRGQRNFGTADPAGAGINKPIVALENQWLQVATAQNPGLVAANYDDRLVDTDSSGKVTNKAQGLADLMAAKYANAEHENVQLTVFGDTAIATGRFKAKGTDSKGQPFDVHDRCTDTWVTIPSGKWLCVASHSSPIAKQEVGYRAP